MVRQKKDVSVGNYRKYCTLWLKKLLQVRLTHSFICLSSLWEVRVLLGCQKLQFTAFCKCQSQKNSSLMGGYSLGILVTHLLS